MTCRWSGVASVALAVAVAISGCANKQASMSELELVELVDGAKIADWKDVGNGAIDAAGTGLVQEAREWQKEAKVLEQQMNASGPLAMFGRSVDAELEKRGMSMPTQADREKVTREVMSWMEPADQAKLREAIAASTALADQQAKDDKVLEEMLGKIYSEVQKQLNDSAAGKSVWAIAVEQAGPGYEAKKQLDALGEFFDNGRELIRMYQARLNNLTTIAEAVAKAEGAAR
jgi:hypothetical protein